MSYKVLTDLNPDSIGEYFDPIVEGVNSQVNMVHTTVEKLIATYNDGLSSVVYDTETREGVSHARVIRLTKGFENQICTESSHVGELGTVFTAQSARGTNATNLAIANLAQVMDGLAERENMHIVIGTLTTIQMARKLRVLEDCGYKVFLSHHNADLQDGIRGNPFANLTCVCDENIGPEGGRGVQFGNNACPIQTRLPRNIIIPISEIDEFIKAKKLSVKENGSFGECLMFVIRKDDDRGEKAFTDFMNMNRDTRKDLPENDFEEIRQQLISAGYYES